MTDLAVYACPVGSCEYEIAYDPSRPENAHTRIVKHASRHSYRALLWTIAAIKWSRAKRLLWK